MKSIPLQKVSESPAREVPIDGAIVDSDGDFVLAVEGVEMSRPVIAVEHGHHYREISGMLFSANCLPNDVAAQRPRIAGSLR
jgi:hypothetical protein